MKIFTPFFYYSFRQLGMFHKEFDHIVAINVYKDITLIGVFVGNPVLFKIKSKAVAENFKAYFAVLWKLGMT